jgi:hypothetical protein
MPGAKKKYLAEVEAAEEETALDAMEMATAVLSSGAVPGSSVLGSSDLGGLPVYTASNLQQWLANANVTWVAPEETSSTQSVVATPAPPTAAPSSQFLQLTPDALQQLNDAIQEAVGPQFLQLTPDALERLDTAIEEAAGPYNPDTGLPLSISEVLSGTGWMPGLGNLMNPSLGGINDNPPALASPTPDVQAEVSFEDVFRGSGVAQGLGGILTGTGISFVPGGFLAAPVGQATGVLPRPTRTFQFFEGAGETATGFAQLLGGIGGEIGGSALDALGAAGAPETVGASLVFTAAGVSLNVASWGLVAQGASNIATGVGTSLHALFRNGAEDLPEGTHSIVFDDPDQPVATGSDSGREILAQNLENIGEPRPSPYHEAHHIVPENDVRAARAREILDEANIGINDSDNGAWLARTSRGADSESGIIGDSFSSHDSIHTNRYMTELTNRLEMAQEADRVVEELELIKIQIELGIFPH